MESDRFDRLARTLSSSPSRRGVLHVGAAGVLAALGWDAETAAKRKKKKKCKSPKVKCGKLCCAANQICSGGRCVTPECRRDSDCRDQGTSCQQGRCQAICPTGACPGCDFCLARLRANGTRERACSGLFAEPLPERPCTSDANCLNDAPLCMNLEPDKPCSTPPCGRCIVSQVACNTAAECRSTSDCQDRSEDCFASECQPICSPQFCPNGCLCTVEYPSAGGRVPLCAANVTFPPQPTPCTTTLDCAATEICLRSPVTSCAVDPCGECAVAVAACV